MRLLAAIFLCVSAAAQSLTCECDHATRAGFEKRTCGLCAEVEKIPGNDPVVFIKDNSPLKPNRWLALPRGHTGHGEELLSDLTFADRTELWRQAIARAKEIWGGRWGLALNGAASRSQCHLHIHIGRLIDGVEWGKFQEISGPEEIPDPGISGVWIHPVANGKLHVHVEISTETVLAR